MRACVQWSNAAVRGKFVESERPSPYSAVITKPNGDGTQTITELRFKGKKEVLVLNP